MGDRKNYRDSRYVCMIKMAGVRNVDRLLSLGTNCVLFPADREIVHPPVGSGGVSLSLPLGLLRLLIRFLISPFVVVPNMYDESMLIDFDI